MSILSEKLMKEKHKGIHEQFDCAYAAMHAHTSLNFSGDSLGMILRTHHKKVIKNQIKQSMRTIGFKTGILRNGLGFYAYQFWEIIVNNRFGSNTTKEKLAEFTDGVLQKMANYLEKQFNDEGRADSIGFLKELV